MTERGRGPLPPELAAFLDAGPAPLVFTLGSAAVMHAGRFLRAERAGGRNYRAAGSVADWCGRSEFTEAQIAGNDLRRALCAVFSKFFRGLR